MADYQIELGVKLDTKNIDTTINKYKGKPIEVKSKLDTDGIKNTLANYKAKPIEVDVKLNTTGIAKKIGELNIKTPVKVDAKLNTKNITSTITNYKAKPIKVGVETNFKGVATQIGNYSKSAKPIKLRAELNNSAVSSAINEFNKKINAAESKTKIKVKAEPDLKGIDKKISSYKVRSPLKVDVKINKTDINNQIKQYDGSKKYISVKAKLDNGAISQAIKDYKATTPIKVDLELDHTDIDEKIKGYASKGGVVIPAKLIPSPQGFTTGLTKKPIQVEATLNPEEINRAIDNFKPRSKISAGIKLVPNDINTDIKKIPKPTEQIEVGAKLDTSNINADIALFKPTAVLGVNSYLIVEDIEEQLSTYVPKTPLKVNVRINDNDVVDAAKKQNAQDYVQVDVQLNREKLSEQIRTFKTTSKLSVGIKLDPKGLAEQIKKVQPKTKIKVGVQIDSDDVARQVGQVDNNTPIKLGVELDKKSVQKIQNQINNLREQVKAIGDIKINLGGADVADNTSGKNRKVKVGGVSQDFVEADIKITDMANHIGSLESALKKIGFNKSSIDSITREFEELDVVVKNVTTRLDKKGNLSLNIKGLDSAGRAVTMIKGIGKDGELTSFGTSISQSFKETEASFARLKTIANQTKGLKVQIEGLDPNKNKAKIAEITSQINSLEAEYKELLLITQQNLNTSQLDELERKSVETANAVKIAKAAMADKTAYNQEQQEIKETRDEYQKLIKIADSIKRIKVTLAGLDSDKDSNRIAELKSQLNSLETQYNDIYAVSQKSFNTQQFDSLKQKAIETENAVKDVKSAMADVGANKASSIRNNFSSYDAQIKSLERDMNNLSNATPKVKTGIDNIKQALQDMRNAADDDSLIEAENRYQNELKETLAQLKINQEAEGMGFDKDTFDTKKEAALARLNGLFEEGSQASKRFGTDAQKLRTELEQVGNVKGVDNVTRKIGNLEKQIKTAGVQTQTFSTRLKEQFSKYSQYISVATIFMKATQAAKSMFEQVKLIDSAMTELKKVTDETDASYNQFLSRAASRSKELGTTIDGLVKSTADFARLGYSFEDSQGLAEVANIYAVVGDEIEGVEGATESLISTMAAFKDDMAGMDNADIAMSIIDTYNELGKLIAYQHSNMLLESGYNG